MVDVLPAIFKTSSMRLLLQQDNYFFQKIMNLYHTVISHLFPEGWFAVGHPFFVPGLKVYNDTVDNSIRTILPGSGIAKECIAGD